MIPPFPSSVVALVCAVTVSLVAFLWGQLSRSGAVAAALVGWLALLAGWKWGVFLLVWFVVMALVSRAGRRQKTLILHGVIEKSGSRDATQVLANGGIFAVAAMLTVLTPVETIAPSALVIIAFTALISAGADTTATEIGTLYGGQPWALKTQRKVSAGTSGAITLAGSIAAVLAAIGFSTFAVLMTLTSPRGAIAITIGAVTAVATDSFLGAWWQSRRWCNTCGMSTEQKRHRCGEQTITVGGLEWLDNDAVNVISGAIGALVALALQAMLGYTALAL